MATPMVAGTGASNGRHGGVASVAASPGRKLRAAPRVRVVSTVAPSASSSFTAYGALPSPVRHAGALAAKGMAEALELTPSKEQAVLQVALATVTAVAAAQKSCAAGPSSATAPTVTPSRSTRSTAASRVRSTVGRSLGSASRVAAATPSAPALTGHKRGTLFVVQPSAKYAERSQYDFEGGAGRRERRKQLGCGRSRGRRVRGVPRTFARRRYRLSMRAIATEPRWWDRESYHHRVVQPLRQPRRGFRGGDLEIRCGRTVPQCPVQFRYVKSRSDLESLTYAKSTNPLTRQAQSRAES